MEQLKTQKQIGKREAPKKTTKKQIAKQAEQTRSEAVRTIDDLQAAVDATRKTYVTLQEDASIKGALAAASKGARSTFKLGPSDDFNKVAKWAAAAGAAVNSIPTDASSPKEKTKKRKGTPKA